MKTFQDFVTIVPASEATPEYGPENAGHVANYHIYFDGAPNERDPYQRGVVVEEWTDGRFYMIDSNYEKVGTRDEVEAYLKEFLVREQYIDETGKVLPTGKTHQQLADEALALDTEEDYGTDAQCEAQDAFYNRVKSVIPASAFEKYESYCNKATFREMIEEGLDQIVRAYADRLHADSGIPSDNRFPKSDANATVEPDSVQALFNELFPAECRFVWIIGGGSMPLDSVCGADCEATLRAAKALYERPEIDGDVIAKAAAKACEVYING